MEEVRWDDPMAAYLVKKKRLEPVLPDLGDCEKMKESGFVVPKKSQFTAGEEEGLMLHQTDTTRSC
ncbi:hypothetical protein ACJIZ3_018564 [Penstemon smallii]|uniref:Uncharacterized protein n=1 Tax=Penstemon smallii TaxID=265156 RepID=A0ABD3T059_9LAMI